MKRTAFTFVFLLLSFVFASAQAPQGFNYQAMARDAQGNALVNTTVTVNLQILAGSATGTIAWEETHTVTTNSYGIFTLMVGDPAATPGAGSVATFSDMNWSAGPYFLKITANGEIMGTPSQLLAVPYAAFAQDVANKDDADPDPANEIQDLQLSDNQLTITLNGAASVIDLSQYLDNPGWNTIGSDTIIYPGSIAIGTSEPMGSKLAVTGGDVSSSKALFEVKRSDGQTVFAVYNDSIRMYVNASSTKKSKGGFAIGGFGAQKGFQDYLRVTPDSVRVYIDQTATKRSKGGFAIGGFGATKAGVTGLMYLGKDNYFIGHQSGENTTTGLYNQFFGFQAGMTNTIGSNNVFLGYRSGHENLSGQKNVFIGNDAGYSNTGGGYNIFVGTSAGYNNLNGMYNIFMGYEAGDRNQSGSYNVFIGQQSGWYNTTGTQNSYVGYQSGLNNTTGSFNAMMGLQSGLSNTTGNYNSYLGYQSAYFNTTGQKNVAIGYRAGRGASGVSTGSNNVFIGNESGYSNTSGVSNTFVGDEAGHSNTTGYYNTFVGYLSGYSNMDAYYNTMIGYYSGYSTNHGFNTMVGYYAGYSNVEGANAAYLGYRAGYANTGTNNTFLGSESGYYNAAGSGNVFVGLGSGRQSDGSDNVFIGKYAGYSETGSSKLVINSGYTGADNANNALIYGDFNSDQLRINGEVGINRIPNSSWALSIDMDADDNYGLVVYGPTYCSSGAWESSDKRLKKNITTLQDPLQKIIQLRGVNFYWKTEEFSNRHYKETKQIGVIAQEVEKVFPELVNEGPEGYKSVDYSKFSVVLIEAIKEQQKQIDQLKNEIKLLKKQK